MGSANKNIPRGVISADAKGELYRLVPVQNNALSPIAGASVGSLHNNDFSGVQNREALENKSALSMSKNGFLLRQSQVNPSLSTGKKAMLYKN